MTHVNGIVVVAEVVVVGVVALVVVVVVAVVGATKMSKIVLHDAVSSRSRSRSRRRRLQMKLFRLCGTCVYFSSFDWRLRRFTVDSPPHSSLPFPPCHFL